MSSCVSGWMHRTKPTMKNLIEALRGSAQDQRNSTYIGIFGSLYSERVNAQSLARAEILEKAAELLDEKEE